MCTTLSAGRWVFLLSLLALMVFSSAGVNSFDLIAETCCHNVTSIRVPKIKACYEQTAGKRCRIHAFVVKGKRGKWRCISPEAQWLVDMIKKGKLTCSLN